jgi:hypothetical protein
MARSMDAVSWTITHISYYSNAAIKLNIPFLGPNPIIDNGDFFIYMNMSSIGFRMACTASSEKLMLRYDGSMASDDWYDCLWPGVNPPDTPPTWVRFNQYTFDVTLKQSWICDGEDPLHP